MQNFVCTSKINPFQWHSSCLKISLPTQYQYLFCDFSCDLVKVRQSQQQIPFFSFPPKNNWKYFQNPALPLKGRIRKVFSFTFLRKWEQGYLLLKFSDLYCPKKSQEGILLTSLSHTNWNSQWVKGIISVIIFSAFRWKCHFSLGGKNP